jgi:hypothetical protein
MTVAVPVATTSPIATLAIVARPLVVPALVAAAVALVATTVPEPATVTLMTAYRSRVTACGLRRGSGGCGRRRRAAHAYGSH